jgi:hypothetical protein
MIFLLPSEPFNPKKVDYEFKSEFASISILGFKIYLFDHDKFTTDGEFISNFDFTNKSDLVILRSWMLKSDQYDKLWNILNNKGFSMINTPTQYLNCHHYPNVYDKIEKFTPQSIWFNDLSDNNCINMRKLIDGDVIIKDYVKSEKGFDDIFILEKDILNEDLIRRVHKFKDSRGKLFNEGIVFKKKLNLKKYGDKTNEFRLFYLYHKLISICQNSELGFGSNPYISFLDPIVDKIDSNFFTVDLAELEDGNWTIIECGDGSVSGLSPNQNNLVFYMNFDKLQEQYLN